LACSSQRCHVVDFADPLIAVGNSDLMCYNL
jgi:hypothetical protein